MNKQEKLDALNEQLKDLQYKLVSADQVENVLCDNVTDQDIPEIKLCLKDMEAILKAYQGLGLAAPQIGIKKKFYIVLSNGQYELFCNAKFYQGNASRNTHYEGCLSYPFFDQVKVKRWKEIILHYDMIINDKLIPMKKKIKGVEAFAHQHEIQHCGQNDQFGTTIYQ